MPNHMLLVLQLSSGGSRLLQSTDDIRVVDLTVRSVDEGQLLVIACATSSARDLLDPVM
jgi:hypothetical protein